jgi:RND family efflux transporter MFP subunit
MVAVAALVNAAACGGTNEANGAQPAEDTASAPTRVVEVETLELEPREFIEYVTVTGDVEANRNVTVAAEESGVIRALYVDKGERVAESQQIARIDDSVLRAQAEQARSEANLAQETWERQRRLWEDDSIGSEIAYLRARYGAETAEANARALEARLARTIIRAPIAGTLDDRMVEVGSTVIPGTPVAQIVDADPLEVNAGIPERFAGDFRAGGTAMLTFDHLPGQMITGRLTFVGTAVDEQSRTFPVEIALPNRDGSLKPGMVARVQAPRRTLTDALVVPRDAVVRSAEGYIVYVVEDEGGRQTARARTVITGPGAGGQVVIEDGVAPGERVVVVGQQRLANGDLVRAVDRTEKGGQ